MIMTAAQFRTQTGIQLKSAFLSKKSSDEVLGIHSDLGDLETGNYPKFDPQARWKFMVALAGKCVSYLDDKQSKGRNLTKPKHQCIDMLSNQLSQQVVKEMKKSQTYGARVGQYDGNTTGVVMGRNNHHHDKVKFELALGGSGPVVNGQKLWEAAEAAGVKLTGNDSQDAYILRSWLKQMAVQKKLKKHVLTPLEYADSTKRAQYLLSFSNTACLQNTAPFNTTAGFVIGEEGAGPFVISEGGEWYAKAGNFGTSAFHHSSFLSGAPVMLAGTIRVAAGTLQYISNNSGHYAPRIADLVNGARELKNCGLDQATRHKVSILAADFEGKYSNVPGAQFLFPYTSFVRLRGAVPNPANYAIDAKFDKLHWKNPTAARPEHRATVGQKTSDGVEVAFPA